MCAGGEIKVIKQTSLGKLIIKPIEKELAKEIIIKNHYSHKWNNADFGKYCFGIFKTDKPHNCLGVAAYGYVKNKNGRMFKHPNPKAWMCELNRLWISDELGKNAETILIGTTIKLLKQLDKNLVAIQSFADGRLGCGTIYKAANFNYYGYHYTRFMRNKRNNEFIHEQNFTNSTAPSCYLRANIAYLIGDLESYKVKTYRYIYPLSKHFVFVKAQMPYPPYDKGMNPDVWTRDKAKIKQNIVRLLDKV